MDSSGADSGNPCPELDVYVPELSASFIGLAPDAVDEAIVAAEQTLCGIIGLDRVTLFQLQADGESMMSTHTWPLEPPEPTIKSSDLPYLSATLFRGEVVRFESRSHFPPEGQADRDWIANIGGPMSAVAFPFLAGGRVFGALAFSTFTRERTWPDGLMRKLQFISDIFANTIARRRLWAELQANMTHTTLAIEAAKIGLWNWDSSGRLWAPGGRRGRSWASVLTSRSTMTSLSSGCIRTIAPRCARR